jgi:hypothetical protein
MIFYHAHRTTRCTTPYHVAQYQRPRCSSRASNGAFICSDLPVMVQLHASPSHFVPEPVKGAAMRVVECACAVSHVVCAARVNGNIPNTCFNFVTPSSPPVRRSSRYCHHGFGFSDSKGRPFTSLPVLLAASFIIYALGLVVYRLSLHPLAKFPGPRIAAVTSLYEGYFEIVKKGHFSRQISKLHDQYGGLQLFSLCAIERDQALNIFWTKDLN